jgi:hypothetical protein
MRFIACVCVLLASTYAHAIDRKVLVIGIDGVRSDAFQAANTPNMDAIIANGASTFNCQSEDITISGPAWTTILTGVHRDKHLITSNSFMPNALGTYPHFFARLRSVCPDVRTASIAHWAPINTWITQDHANVVQTFATDDEVRNAVIAELSGGTCDVVYLHFDDVDHAGHGSGFSPTVPAYIQAIEQTDVRVGQIMAALNARPTRASEDWLVIITSDHGGSGTSHGQNIPEHRTTLLVVSGQSTQVATTIPNPVTLADVAPTITTFLGVSIDPGWGWDGVAVGLNMQGSTSQPVSCTPRTILLTENFEGVTLGPSVNEAAATAVWSGTPPTGWVVDDSGVPGLTDPNVGMTEWEGWAMTSKTWWSAIAADQGRAQFTRASGTIAVADPDEWDDRGTPSALGTFNAHLTSPPISLAGIEPGSVEVAFDSSWRFEGAQRALLTARFDGGAPVVIIDWRSQAGATFKADATNEAVRRSIPNPAGASSMTLDFALLDAGNNWWWGIDNVVVDARIPACRADLDNGSTTGTPDGGVDISDLLYFLARFEAGDVQADLDNGSGTGTSDGGVDISDLLFFLVRFEAGC